MDHHNIIVSEAGDWGTSITHVHARVALSEDGRDYLLLCGRRADGSIGHLRARGRTVEEFKSVVEQAVTAACPRIEIDYERRFPTLNLSRH